jgi:precorrin-2/cobalt-factor-2 C20-methyltransferase
MSGENPGTFYGVGVGPGDPELITRKAARILAEVDRIFYPMETRGGTSFARRIIAPLGVPEAKCQAIHMGMSRDRSNELLTYENAVNVMVTELRQGKSVAWVTQGDPLFYSTFIHLYEQMRQNFPDIPVAIIPGVTSTSAAAARAGIPVARLEEKVAVLPAVYGLTELVALLDEFATVFLMKVNSVFDQLLDILGTLPPTVHGVYLENIGTAEERLVTDLESLRGQKLPYFSLILLRRERRPAHTLERQETA